MLRRKSGFATPTSKNVARICESEGDATLAERFQDLFKDTQALPRAATLADAEIAAEVAAVRDRRFGQVPGKSRCTP